MNLFFFFFYFFRNCSKRCRHERKIHSAFHRWVNRHLIQQHDCIPLVAHSYHFWAPSTWNCSVPLRKSILNPVRHYTVSHSGITLGQKRVAPLSYKAWLCIYSIVCSLSFLPASIRCAVVSPLSTDTAVGQETVAWLSCKVMCRQIAHGLKPAELW